MTVWSAKTVAAVRQIPITTLHAIFVFTLQNSLCFVKVRIKRPVNPPDDQLGIGPGRSTPCISDSPILATGVPGDFRMIPNKK
jgi:hypothetical protein